jgi:hypothetical protein
VVLGSGSQASSANVAMRVLGWVGMSPVYTLYRNGPRILPASTGT